MIEQAQGLRFHPALMLIDDADKPAKWYFALKQARLTGSGGHPLERPGDAALAQLRLGEGSRKLLAQGARINGAAACRGPSLRSFCAPFASELCLAPAPKLGWTGCESNRSVKGRIRLFTRSNSPCWMLAPADSRSNCLCIGCSVDRSARP